VLSADYARWMQCAAIRERVDDPVEDIDVPARKMSWHDFKNRTVRLGLYRLRDGWGPLPRVLSARERGG
jgi:hypothetical protein